MSIRLTVSVAILLAATATAALCEETQMLLRRIGPMERAAGSGDVVDSGPVKLYAARREAESFQFVVLARGGDLRGVTLEAGALRGPGGARIAASNISLFREHYISFKKGLKTSPLPPGSYPDALIPLHNPYGATTAAAVKYPGQPFDLAEGGNQPIWVEISIPRSAKPGSYSGEIVVTAEGGQRATLPYRLRVWDFVLPKIPALKSSFGAYRVEDYYEIERHTEQHYVMGRRYGDMLLEHRLAITWADDMQFDADEDGNIYLVDEIGPLGSSLDVFNHYMKQGGMSTLTVPAWYGWPITDPLGDGRDAMITYLRNFGEIARQGGWADRLYAYVVDEPGDAESYEEVRSWGALLDEAGEEFRLMVTEQPKPSNAGWGTLVGAVDIWCPIPAAFNNSDIEARLADGDEVWIYTALSQDRFSPKWLLDHLPIEYRIYPWLCFNYGVTGLLYWETTYWEESDDPWTEASTIYRRYVGDGQLLYPGTVDTVGFDGPVASMRFKWIREGMDDYDYFATLAALGDDKYLSRRVKAVGSNWRKWTTDPKVLMKQRKRIGRRIEKLSANQ